MDISSFSYYYQQSFNKMTGLEMFTFNKRFESLLYAEYAEQERDGLYDLMQFWFANSMSQLTDTLPTVGQIISLISEKNQLAKSALDSQTAEKKETYKYFLLFDHILQHSGEALSLDLINEMYELLTGNTYEHPAELDDLICRYNSKQDEIYADKFYPLVQFYVKLEGMTVSLNVNDIEKQFHYAILFRECCHHLITPFALRNCNREMYSKSLRACLENDPEGNLLTAYFQTEQKYFYEQALEMIYGVGKDISNEMRTTNLLDERE